MADGGFYIHRYEQGGRNAPLPRGKYTMILDKYWCERSPALGESGTSYRDYALQHGDFFSSTEETHVVE